MSIEAVSGCLDGVRVIDLTQRIAGPYATKLLADYGADVIKIERPDGGDAARQMPPFLNDEPHPEGSGLFLHLNTNKRSVTLNLKSQPGQRILRELTREADVLIESYAPGRMESWGLDYATLESANPRLVMTSLSNFGQSGPYRDYKLTEITLYGLGATMHENGLADREPIKLGLTVEQFYAGTLTAVATLGAYVGAAFQGVGQYLDISLFEIQAGNQDRAIQEQMIHQYVGRRWPPRMSIGSIGDNLLPRGAYPVSDGYVVFHTLQPLWERVCRMIEREDLIDDPYFTAPENFNGNAEVKAEFDAVLLEWLLRHGKRDVMRRAQETGYMCTAVNGIDELIDDPHFAARDFFTRVEHPFAGELTYPGAPFRMSETPWRAGRAPLLGEHTDEVLRELGYSTEDVGMLREEGVV